MTIEQEFERLREAVKDVQVAILMSLGMTEAERAFIMTRPESDSLTTSMQILKARPASAIDVIPAGVKQL